MADDNSSLNDLHSFYSNQHRTCIRVSLQPLQCVVLSFTVSILHKIIQMYKQYTLHTLLVTKNSTRKKIGARYIESRAGEPSEQAHERVHELI